MYFAIQSSVVLPRNRKTDNGRADAPYGALYLSKTAEWLKISNKMRYFYGFAIMTAFFVAGTELHKLGVPIPSGVMGLLLFYLAMSAGLVKLEWVEGMASLLLRHMVLLFVPLTVGLMDMGPVLSQHLAAIVASLLVSLVVVLLTTGLMGRWLLPAEPILPGLPLPSPVQPSREKNLLVSKADKAVEEGRA
jgi:holin-like protein